MESPNQTNQKNRKLLQSSNKIFQRKESAKPTTKKTLKRIREKLQTQCQERTSIKLQKPDLKILTKKLKPLFFGKEPKTTCISPSIRDEGFDCLSPNSPNDMMNSFAIHRLLDLAGFKESPQVKSPAIIRQINLNSGHYFSPITSNKGKTRVCSPDKNKQLQIQSLSDKCQSFKRRARSQNISRFAFTIKQIQTD